MHIFTEITTCLTCFSDCIRTSVLRRYDLSRGPCGICAFGVLRQNLEGSERCSASRGVGRDLRGHAKSHGDPAGSLWCRGPVTGSDKVGSDRRRGNGKGGRVETTLVDPGLGLFGGCFGCFRGARVSYFLVTHHYHASGDGRDGRKEGLVTRIGNCSVRCGCVSWGQQDLKRRVVKEFVWSNNEVMDGFMFQINCLRLKSLFFPALEPAVVVVVPHIVVPSAVLGANSQYVWQICCRNCDNLVMNYRLPHSWARGQPAS